MESDPHSNLNIAIVAGETSGDLVGGALAAAIRSIRPDINLWGIGGRHLKKAGVRLIADSTSWGAISITEALKLYPRLRFGALPRLLRELSKSEPNLVVLIDFGAFNVKVAAWCKSRGIPVLYYFPPGSWKKYGKVNPHITQITDAIATPFPWSEGRLKAVGANVRFVGHPLVDLVCVTQSRDDWLKNLGIDSSSINRHPVLGVLPGSRRFEIRYNLPVMLETASVLGRRFGGLTVFIGAAHDRAWDQITRIVRQFNDQNNSNAEQTVQIHVLRQMTHEIMKHSDALLVCSGTATLEAALLGTPMAIIYRGSRLMELEGWIRRVRPEHIGMPNIIAGRRIVPEFIQHSANSTALSEVLEKMITDQAIRSEMIRDLSDVKAALGQPGATLRTAQWAVELATASA